MKIEKKLVACSILALLIGVSSVVPLLFLMSGTAKAETAPKPWFNVNVPYAYWIAENGTSDTLLYPPNLDNAEIYGDLYPPDFDPANFSNREFFSVKHSIVLNFTLNPEAKNEISDARFEYYQLQIYSDKAPIANTSYFVGTNRTSSFEFEPVSFYFMRDDWFDSNTTGGGMFTYNWNESSSELTIIGGASGGTSGSGTDQLFYALREAETIYIDVSRVGLVTFNGNSTVVNLSSNEIIQHIELKKFGDGFLYNAIFPEDQLSQIDLFNPLKSLDQQKP